jgi:leucyl-tRNA synthetase
MNHDKYDPAAIEKKWQEKWQRDQIYKTLDPTDKPKFYILDMFPYPSGEGLHVGHPKGYIATDVVSRMKRMQGFNVLHPMGFDAFGLPAEQYAIKTKTNPAVAVEKNVAHYKQQLEILGFDYDWSREVNTTDPKFYKWTQWIFLKLLEKGLAKESFEPVNWCPFDKTVLANEDVEDGKCERCGTPVEKKFLKQWVLKITDYADRLIADLDAKDAQGKPLLDWPESIKEAQRNWIGRSEGAEIDFNIAFTKHPEDNGRRGPDGKRAQFTVFTTRPDTLFGVTYVVISPEHQWVKLATDDKHDVLENKEEVIEYIKSAGAKTEIERTDATKEKTGVELKGVMAVNPATGEEVPVWVADYVLADYGTGIVMAVPAHDERDYAFAKKYNLPIKEVVIPNIVDERNPPAEGKKVVERKNIHAIVRNPKTGKYLAMHVKKFDWTTFPMGGVEEGESVIDAARREVKEETGYANLNLIRVLQGTVRAEYFAAHKDQNRVSYTNAVLFELADETQVEITEEEKNDHDIIWLDESQLNYQNMTHAEVGRWNEMLKHCNYVFTDSGHLINSGSFSGLESEGVKKKITESVGGRWVTKYKLRDWVFSRQRYWGEPIPVFHDEEGNIVPLSEKDLPLILPPVEHYEPTDTGESPLANISDWVNVIKDGKKLRRETNTMPQWAGSSWYYLRYMDPHDDAKLVDPEKEKYWNSVDLYVGGAEHATRHLIYARFWHKFLYDIGVVSTIEPFKKLQSVGLIMADDGRKMSKRWGNVINPDDIVANFGADSMRLYEMFMGPFDQAISWNTNGLVGTRRFIEKAWRLKEKIDAENQTLSSLLNRTIKKISDDIGEMKFNTAVSQLMITVNELEKQQSVSKADYEALLKLLAPFAPHVAEELWHLLGNENSIHLESWPSYDESKLVDNKAKVAIQINGKVREVIEVDVDSEESVIKEQALVLSGVKKWIDGKGVKGFIYIKNKVLNIIVDLEG